MKPEDFLLQALGLEETPVLRSLLATGEVISVKKHELLFRERDFPEHIFFLIDGIYRGFFENVNGKDITDCFCCIPGEPIVASLPFTSTANVSMEAIQAGSVFALPVGIVSNLFENDPALVRIYNRLLIDSLYRHVETKKMLYQFDAMQKYRWFLQKYPGLDGKATVRCIASYLGITPVTLSRVRSEVRSEMAREAEKQPT